jgi:hypothetical protein
MYRVVNERRRREREKGESANPHLLHRVYKEWTTHGPIIVWTRFLRVGTGGKNRARNISESTVRLDKGNQEYNQRHWKQWKTVK